MLMDLEISVQFREIVASIEVPFLAVKSLSYDSSQHNQLQYHLCNFARDLLQFFRFQKVEVYYFKILNPSSLAQGAQQEIIGTLGCTVACTSQN